MDLLITRQQMHDLRTAFDRMLSAGELLADNLGSDAIRFLNILRRNAREAMAILDAVGERRLKSFGEPDDGGRGL